MKKSSISGMSCNNSPDMLISEIRKYIEDRMKF